MVRGVALIAAVGVAGWCSGAALDDAPAERLKVSVLTFGRGEAFYQRNMLLNPCYQDYPVHEFLVADASRGFPEKWRPALRGELAELEVKTGPRGPKVTPRKIFASAACGFRLEYHWFDLNDELAQIRADASGTPKPEGVGCHGGRCPHIGHLRTYLSRRAAGDVLVSMDGDDFYHAHYVSHVVAGLRGDGLGLPPDEARAEAVVVAPHAFAYLMPDGSVSVTRADGALADRHWRVARGGPGKPEDIGKGHATVLTKRAFQQCPWGRQRRSEEHDLIRCLRAKGMAPRALPAAGSQEPWGNALLLVKIDNMGLTAWWSDQLRQLAPLTLEDRRAMIRGLERWYEDFHELSRPPATPRAPGGAPFTRGKTRRQMWQENDWNRFHNRQGIVNRDPPTECDGFAHVHGVVVHGPGEAPAPGSVADCCAACRALNATARPCVAFTHDSRQKSGCAIHRASEDAAPGAPPKSASFDMYPSLIPEEPTAYLLIAAESGGPRDLKNFWKWHAGRSLPVHGGSLPSLNERRRAGGRGGRGALHGA